MIWFILIPSLVAATLGVVILLGTAFAERTHTVKQDPENTQHDEV